jgi:protein O-GlcNAc transferase
VTMIDPYITKLMDLARFHFLAGSTSRAEEYCRTVLEISTMNAEASYLLSKVLCKDQRWSEAAVLLDQMVASFPATPFLVNDYCRALDRSQQVPDGIVRLETLCHQHPEVSHLHLNLGKLYVSSHNAAQAQRCFRRALELDPTNVDALLLLGNSLWKGEHLVEAEGCLGLAADLEQGRSDLLNSLSCVLKALGRSDEAARCSRSALELVPNNLTLYDNYLTNYLCTELFTPEHVFSEHRDWAIRHAEQHYHGIPRHTNVPNPARRLRVGYVSADFRTHPVAFFIEPILSLHDRNAFDVFCYAQLADPDSISGQIRALHVTWRQIDQISDAQVAATILEDGIDILVDLGGHTAANRLLIFARKPAPIQVAWLGYAHSTGLTSIDYRISDQIADPPGMTEHLHTEQIYRLDGSFICYRPPQDPPPVAEAPFLRNGPVTFGIFNNLAKWNPTMVGLWAEILLRVPGSRLLIKTPQIQHEEESAYVARQFAALGVDVARLSIVKRSPTIMDHLETVGEADVALDSFPYNGTTTTCESLFMGVPVVSLAGRSHASRVGASILTGSGLAELVADSTERYVEIAVNLALAPGKMLAYRRDLRSILARSPFFDVHGFTRRLEAGYRDMWHTWCDKQNGKGA